PITWQPPPTMFVKCNIDATVFMPEQKVSMGACLRNENVVMTTAKAEVWGLLQGHKWIASLVTIK
ncbi:hypothetical protein A2U01_0037269, partial [Trifolium medium]|nr:hypothetical protein [Trifolium medium]